MRNLRPEPATKGHGRFIHGLNIWDGGTHEIPHHRKLLIVAPVGWGTLVGVVFKQNQKGAHSDSFQGSPCTLSQRRVGHVKQIKP